jgi:hypothetical protein
MNNVRPYLKMLTEEKIHQAHQICMIFRCGKERIL